MKRSAFQLSKHKPRRVVQDIAAIDQFGELAERKRIATATAHRLGHQLGPWRRRSNDIYGRLNAFCFMCNAIAVVCTEEPDDIPAMVYGTAIVRDCGKRHNG